MNPVARKADKKLRKCRRLMRMTQTNLSDLRSPKMDGMPISPSYGNAVENRIVNQVDKKTEALSELKDIYSAITWLKKDEQELLFVKYFDFEEPSNRMVSTVLHIDESQFYRIRNKALYKFAESYRAGVLFEEF